MSHNLHLYDTYPHKHSNAAKRTVEPPVTPLSFLPPMQANLCGKVAVAGAGRLLHHRAADHPVHRAARRADLHLHAHRDRGVGQAAARRGGKLARPADGQIEAQGRWTLVVAVVSLCRIPTPSKPATANLDRIEHPKPVCGLETFGVVRSRHPE